MKMLLRLKLKNFWSAFSGMHPSPVVTGEGSEGAQEMLTRNSKRFLNETPNDLYSSDWESICFLGED